MQPLYGKAVSEADLVLINRGGSVWACWLSGKPAVNLGTPTEVAAAFREFCRADDSVVRDTEPGKPTREETDVAEIPRRATAIERSSLLHKPSEGLGCTPREHVERKQDRHKLTVIGKIYTSSGQREVTVLDLSCDGCRFHEPSGSLREGNKLTIRLGTIGPVGATVRWRERDHVGIMFDTPLYPSIMDHIRHNMDLRR